MLKPLDIVVLSALLGFEPDARQTFVEIARQLGSNPSTVTRAVNRLTASGLLRPTRRGSLTPADYRIDRPGTIEVIVHALRYFMPVVPGAPHRGLATAHGGPDLVDRVRSQSGYVWPLADGQSHGLTIEPLHPLVPDASRSHPTFYRIMSLADVFRVGRVRERAIAEEILRSLLGAGGEVSDG